MKFIREDLNIAKRKFAGGVFLSCTFNKLEGSKIVRYSLRYCNFKADIHNVRFENCTFNKCTFKFVEFVDCEFVNCEFYECDLQGVTLVNCKGQVCKDIKLMGCKIDCADFNNRVVTCLDYVNRGEFIYCNIDAGYVNMANGSNLEVLDMRTFKDMVRVYENTGNHSLSAVYKYFEAMGGL